MRCNEYALQRIVVSIVFLIVGLAMPNFAETAYQIKTEDKEEDKTVVASEEKTARKSEEETEKEQVPVEDEAGEEEQDASGGEEAEDAQAPAGEADAVEEQEVEKAEKIPAVEEEDSKDLGEDYVPEGESDQFFATEKDMYEEWIAGHFAIGVRYTSYEFDRPKESGEDDEYFIGSNDTLKEDEPGFGIQNINLLWFPFADSQEWVSESTREDWRIFFAIIKGMGLELTWDHLRGKTWTSLSEKHTREYTDGTIVAKAIMLSVVFNIENSSPVTPYFGFGTASYNDLSVTEGWWHYGFGGSNPEEAYQDWRDAGSPGDPNGGYRRTFTVDSSTGSFWYIGATVEVYENWNLDFFYRETEVEFDNTYTLSFGDNVIDTRYSKWDLSNTTYGFGVRYTF